MSKSTKTTSKTVSAAVTPKPSPVEASVQQYGLESWRKTSAMTYIAPPERSDEKKQFFDSIWPVSEIYTSVLSPIFLADLQDEAAKNPKGEWLVRDGLLPLIWFFTKNPEPVSFEGRLRIHSDFEEFVPDAWRPQVELYRFFSDETQGYADHAAKEVKELLLIGLIMPSVISLARVENELTKIIEQIGGKKGLSKIRVRAFLPFRFESIASSGGMSYYNRYMQIINRLVGTDVEFLEFEGFKWLYPSPGTFVHEFNEKWIYADSYLSTIAMSKPVQFVNIGGATETRHDFDTVYPIYPHVSCHVRRNFKKPFIDYLSGKWAAESQERAQLYYSAMNSEANNAHPWPNWFESWCKDVITDKSV